MDYRKLGNTELLVSSLSYGASSLGSVFRRIDEPEGIRAVHAALDLGMNFIDVSPYYGLTVAETVLGRALRQVPRDKYYLATKVGRYGHDMNSFDFSAKRVLSSVIESMSRLKVDYIDLIQCHDIEFGDLDQIINETIPALYKLQDAGLVRYVGITGYPLKSLQHVVERTRVDTMLSYCHYTVFDTTLTGVIPLFEEHNVGILNAAPLGMGLLTNQGPPNWHPASEEIKQCCSKAAAFCREQGKNIAQLAIQFSTEVNVVSTTLVGTANPKNLIRNYRWTESPLDRTLLAQVLAILAPIKDQPWLSGRLENN